MKLKGHNFATFLTILGACIFVELIAGFLTAKSVHTWYPHLIKPDWTPPKIVFAPLLTVLYLLMAFALWFVWKTPSKKSKTSSYFFFWTQLFLNLIWSGLFFALRNPLLGLVDIFLLLILISCTLWNFYQIRPIAAFLLIPYLIWVTYATALNYVIWRLN